MFSIFLRETCMNQWSWANYQQRVCTWVMLTRWLPQFFFPQKTLFLDIFNPNMSHIRCNRSKKPFTACLSLVSLHKLFMTFSLGHAQKSKVWVTYMYVFRLLVFSFGFFLFLLYILVTQAILKFSRGCWTESKTVRASIIKCDTNDFRAFF